jgi:hypothetical protein
VPSQKLLFGKNQDGIEPVAPEPVDDTLRERREFSRSLSLPAKGLCGFSEKRDYRFRGGSAGARECFKLSRNRDEQSNENIIQHLHAQRGDARTIAEEMRKRKAQVFQKRQ